MLRNVINRTAYLCEILRQNREVTFDDEILNL